MNGNKTYIKFSMLKINVSVLGDDIISSKHDIMTGLNHEIHQLSHIFRII